MARSIYRLLALCALLSAALGMVTTTAASAASRNQIIKDCSDDGRLQGKYSARELRDARQNLPADVDQYTDCRDVLRRAELPESGSGAGTGGTGGTTGTGAGQFGGTAGQSRTDPGYRTGSDGRRLQTPYTKDDDQRLADAKAAAANPVALGEESVRPGTPSGDGDGGIPGSLLVVLILLAVAGAAAGVIVGRKRVLHRGTA